MKKNDYISPTEEAAPLMPRKRLPCPYSQLLVTVANPETYSDEMERLNRIAGTIPAIGATEGMKEHPAILHYFYGGTDIYICEFDGKDEMFGFTILNGDLDNSEWGYISLSEITSIPLLNIDYYFEEQSIEVALFRKYQKHFKKPASLQK
jgi:hypothetical protein